MDDLRNILMQLADIQSSNIFYAPFSGSNKDEKIKLLKKLQNIFYTPPGGGILVEDSTLHSAWVEATRALSNIHGTERTFTSNDDVDSDGNTITTIDERCRKATQLYAYVLKKLDKPGDMMRIKIEQIRDSGL